MVAKKKILVLKGSGMQQFYEVTAFVSKRELLTMH